MFPSPTGSVVKQHEGRAGTAMPAIVRYDGPEVAALGGLPARLQNRRAGLVDEDPVGGAQVPRAHPATRGRRERSGLASLQSNPSNSAASCAEDMRITPSRTCGQTNLPPSRRL